MDITKCSHVTICELTAAGIAMTDDEDLIRILLKIKDCAEHMEDRLEKYCSAIESLGFQRVGRGYNDYN
jgi:hypothetical protein